MKKFIFTREKAENQSLILYYIKTRIDFRILLTIFKVNYIIIVNPVKISDINSTGFSSKILGDF